MESPTRHRRWRIASIAGTALAAVAATVFAALPAAAAIDGDYQISGARILASPNGSAAVVGLGYPGQRVTILCGMYGPWSTDTTTQDLWIRHRNNTSGITGYTTGGNIGPWTWNTLPKC